MISVKNTLHWENEEKILNYELFSGVNCVNKFATDKILQAYEESKELDAAEKRA